MAGDTRKTANPAGFLAFRGLAGRGSAYYIRFVVLDVGGSNPLTRPIPPFVVRPYLHGHPNG